MDCFISFSLGGTSNHDEMCHMTFVRWQQCMPGAWVGLWLIFFGCGGWNVHTLNLKPDGDWTMNGRDAFRSWNTTGSLHPPLKLLWTYDASAATGSPAAADNVLFVGTYRGELHAISIANGDRIGRIYLEGAVHATPVLDSAVIYVACASGEETFQAVDIKSGEALWKRKLGAVETSPILNKTFLYVTTMDGSVYCLAKATGEELWKYSIPKSKRHTQIHSSPATDGNILVFGDDDGLVYALDAVKGSLLWKVRTKGSIFGSPAIASNRVVIGSMDHYLYAFTTGDGSLCWKSDFGGALYSPPAIAENTVVVGAANGLVRGLSLITGELIWEYPTTSVISAPGVICSGIVYLGTLDRVLYAFDLRNGKVLWRSSVEGRIKSPPIVWNDILFVPVEDKYIDAYISEK